MDRGAWKATVHAIAESDMTEHTHSKHIITIAIFGMLLNKKQIIKQRE